MTSVSLTKKERGRLKKLRSRISLNGNGVNGNGMSGIISFKEAEEFKELFKKHLKEEQESNGNYDEIDPCKLLGPTIHLAKVNSTWQISDGIDHQLLVKAIMFQSGLSHQETQTLDMKKRKRNETSDNSKMPSWARLHNPAFAESLAIVEFQVTTSTSDGEQLDESDEIMPSKRRQSDSHTLAKLLSRTGYETRQAIPFDCRLFQGDKPRHATDCLLYVEEKKNGTKKTKLEEVDSEAKEEFESLAQRTLKQLEGLILSEDEMERERYPTAQFDLGKVVDDEAIIKAAKALRWDENGRLIVASDSVVETILQSLLVTIKTYDDNPQENPSYVMTSLRRSQLENTPDHFKVFAIDCEMVKTKVGFELARVTVLEYAPNDDDLEHYVTVMDTLVQPKNPILDYVTAYSGITPTLLDGVTTSLENVQASIVSFICKEDIIIAHSAENDLKALQLVHTRVIDTAILFSDPETRRKHSLKHLSRCLLKKRIQESNGLGHCSEEDAAASLLLAVRRARVGDSFRLHGKPGKKNLLNVLTALNRAPEDDKPPFLNAASGKLVCVAPSDWIKEQVSDQCAANALECENIDSSSVKAVSSYLRPGPRRASFLWSRIILDGSNSKATNDKVDDLLETVIKSAPNSTAIMVIFQRGYSYAKQLFKLRSARLDTRSTLKWHEEDEDNYLEKLAVCRQCEIFWISSMINDDHGGISEPKSVNKIS